ICSDNYIALNHASGKVLVYARVSHSVIAAKYSVSIVLRYIVSEDEANVRLCLSENYVSGVDCSVVIHSGVRGITKYFKEMSITVISSNIVKQVVADRQASRARPDVVHGTNVHS